MSKAKEFEGLELKSAYLHQALALPIWGSHTTLNSTKISKLKMFLTKVKGHDVLLLTAGENQCAIPIQNVAHLVFKDQVEIA